MAREADRKILVCDCEGTMALDGTALGKACGQDLHVYNHLCRAELANAETAAKAGTPCLICCTQEAPLFNETFADAAPVDYVNIREHAGWSDEGAAATPKIAALIRQAALDVPPVRSTTLVSGGRALVYGSGDATVAAAKQLGSRLDVTLLLIDRPGGGEDVIPPAVTDLPVFKGRIAACDGHLGGFALTVDGFAPSIPSSRTRLEFGPEQQNGVEVRFDLIVDLSGGDALMPAAEKRDGYFRPDPNNPAAVQTALFEAADLVGEFEKPLYVTFHENLCAHGRSTIVGCTRCIDACAASAITPDGDRVRIDPAICAGCGSCAGVCPTGAATYAVPPGEVLLLRLRTLLGTYLKAGGQDPVVLLHDTRHGEELIGLAARFGRGLPARVLPFAVNEVTQIGIDFLAAAFAYGAGALTVLVPPARRDEIDSLGGQIAMAETALEGLGYGTGRIAVIDETDPEAVAAMLYRLDPLPAIAPGDFLPMGGKREITLLALHRLFETAPEPADIVALAQGAPFGRVTVEAEGCTLCLSCVGACPTGALLDNPDAPMLHFNEAACIQCGLCRNTCPESVMKLEPRFNFGAGAGRDVLLKEEEPFTCVSCGKPFGTRSTIEKMVEKLAGHSMYSDDPAALERLRMCEGCRVFAQFDAGPQPLAGKERPLPRTTEDYLAERAEAEEEED